MIKLYHDVSDVIHMNEHKKHVNCGLHVIFWNFLLMLFCFMMKNDNFKQKFFGHRSPLRLVEQQQRQLASKSTLGVIM